MPILNDGSFTFTINSEDLIKGLRSTRRTPRDARYLVECAGAVGQDHVLQTLPNLNLNRIDTTVLGPVAFPYPQLFFFHRHTVVCTSHLIYELREGTLTPVFNIGAGNARYTWSAIDSFEYIHMSNGRVAISRNPQSHLWEYVGS